MRMTPERQRKEDDLMAKVKRAQAIYDAMTPEQKAEHDNAQRESWVRGMTARCEHGWLDYEQCPDCRAAARERIKNDRS